jgi:phage recombination protein Bet
MADTAMVQYQANDGTGVKLSPAIVHRYLISGDQNVDDKEIFAFMAKCQARKLNPLAGDAYMVAYKDRQTGRVKANVIVSKDYWVRLASMQPSFDGMQAGVVVAKADGTLERRVGCIVGTRTEKLVGGWATVHDKNRMCPTNIEVSLKEYDTGKSLWKTKPATMIRKVAMVQALREAFPDACGGIYSSEEIEHAQDVPAPAPIPAQDVQEILEQTPAPEVEPEPAPAPEPELDYTYEEQVAEINAETGEIQDAPQEIGF